MTSSTCYNYVVTVYRGKTGLAVGICGLCVQFVASLFICSVSRTSIVFRSTASKSGVLPKLSGNQNHHLASRDITSKSCSLLEACQTTLLEVNEQSTMVRESIFRIQSYGLQSIGRITRHQFYFYKREIGHIHLGRSMIDKRKQTRIGSLPGCCLFQLTSCCGSEAPLWCKHCHNPSGTA